MNLLIPTLSLKAWRMVFGWALFGATLAGLYGIIHDQVTFTLSPEYFTKFKFMQFAHADPGMGERVFVGVIGFLATWWVGAIAGWMLGRFAICKDGTWLAFRLVAPGFLVLLLITAASGVFGYFYGMIRTSSGDLERWECWQEWADVQDIESFARVGYIHNFGYLGAILGLVVAVIILLRAKRQCV